MGVGNRPPVPARASSKTLSLADVVESLAAEFASTLGIQTVVIVVRRCQRELDIAGAASDLLEARARRRLPILDLLQRQADQPTDNDQP
ncbi:MAG: hypothetical protein ACR2P2_10685 [Nakamurella sp.]